MLPESLTLRDYFAAKALNGILVSNTSSDIAPEVLAQVMSMMSYELADAMLSERSKTQPPTKENNPEWQPQKP